MLRIRPAGIRARAAVLLVLAATIVIIIVWRPWDPVPRELRDAVRGASQLAGVAEIDTEHRESVDVPAHKFGPEPSEFRVSIRLDAALNPDDAAGTAERVHDLLVPASETGRREDMSVFLSVTAGEPEDINGVLVEPLHVPYSAISGADDVADAFTIWQAGARSVNVYGIDLPVGGAEVGSELGDAAGSPAGIGIETAVAADMAPLAELAADLGRAADLRLSDGSVRYNGYGSVPDVDAVRLAVAASSRPGVEHTDFSNSTSPQLSIHADRQADSPESRELQHWLEAHSYAANAGRPVAFSISEPGYATITDGWVSAFEPPEPEPDPLPLPSGVERWPEDADAPACTGADLDVTYGGSDAATGARYATLLARNVSGQPCAVEGIPDVVFGSADGAAQADVRFEPYASGVVPARLVVPPGEQMLAPLQWRAMSTANDPDVTTSIRVTAVPGAEPVLLDVTESDSTPAGLDVLAGADVRLGPWVQALDGHNAS